MEQLRGAMFDLDETLVESFERPTPSMAERLTRLIDILPTAIISGAAFERIVDDLVEHLSGVKREHLYLMPSSSAQGYSWDGQWKREYAQDLSPDERLEIRRAIERAILEVPAAHEAPVHGEQIIEKEAQIAFAVIGIDAPHAMKQVWDPQGLKRSAIADYLSLALPAYDVLLGGSTTIDITRRGINKTCGVQWFAKHLGCAAREIVYVGDALYPGGNDYVVVPTGIETIRTSGPEETEHIIDQILARATVVR